LPALQSVGKGHQTISKTLSGAGKSFSQQFSSAGNVLIEAVWKSADIVFRGRFG
jgi:hypothetical protein